MTKKVPKLILKVVDRVPGSHYSTTTSAGYEVLWGFSSKAQADAFLEKWREVCPFVAQQKWNAEYLTCAYLEEWIKGIADGDRAKALLALDASCSTGPTIEAVPVRTVLDAWGPSTNVRPDVEFQNYQI